MPICPHCGHEADATAEACPLCGTRLHTGPEERGGGRPGAGAPAPVTSGESGRQRVPWEDPSLGFGEGMWRTWRASLFDPSRFFARIRDEGTVVRPVLYYLLVVVVASFATLIWEAQGLTLAHYAGYVRMGETSAAGPLISFVLSPFVALALLLLLTVVFHAGALMVAPDRRGMAATARVVCYAAGPSALTVVPLLGAPVGAIWGLVLQVIGLREAHRTSTWRALFMVFWLSIVLFVLGFVLAVLAAAVGGGGDGALVVSPADVTTALEAAGRRVPVPPVSSPAGA